MLLNCVCIDDEPLARECISNYIREVSFLQLIGVGNNPMELGAMQHLPKIDLLFLDIQMPKMNGIDFLKSTPNPPPVIITTAFPSYALESYELDVLDYLLKPITFQRFFQAVSKAKDYHQLLQKADDPVATPAAESYFFIKCEHKFERIYKRDILFVQAFQNYVIIHTTQGKYMPLLFLKTVAEKLADGPFLRVHKSYLVAIDKIDAIDNHEILIGEHRIPYSRQYKDVLMERVVADRLWRK